MPDILQEQAYYPFGMEIEELSMSNLAIPDDYKYNGKELNEEFGLNWYAYGARMYFEVHYANIEVRCFQSTGYIENGVKNRK